MRKWMHVCSTREQINFVSFFTISVCYEAHVYADQWNFNVLVLRYYLDLLDSFRQKKSRENQ